MNHPVNEREWERLVRTAELEVQAVRNSLPAPVRKQADKLPVTYEPRPNQAMIEDGLDDDLLGLFVGEAFNEEFRTDGALPSQILLFLENLWDYAGGDVEIYREEVRRTFLHELGHYLGLDEDDLADRDLD